MLILREPFSKEKKEVRSSGDAGKRQANAVFEQNFRIFQWFVSPPACPEILSDSSWEQFRFISKIFTIHEYSFIYPHVPKIITRSGNSYIFHVRRLMQRTEMTGENPRRIFKAYLKELRAYENEGVRLYYPYDEECSPRFLAETMAKDPGATYMRDLVESEEGKVIKVHFNRILLADEKQGG